MLKSKEVDNWFNKERRTVKSRGIVLTSVEMDDGGILEVINVTSAVDRISADEGIMDRILNHGRSGRGEDTSVLIESGVRGVRSLISGETVYVRVYSGIVFIDEYCLNLYALRRRDMFSASMSGFSRLVN